MNWFVIGGVLLHVLKNAPEAIEAVQKLFDILRDRERAPAEVYEAVKARLTEAKTE